MFALLKQSDARLIQQIISGRRDRFDTLVARYLPAVYAVAYSQLRNHADAEDAVQEAFLSAFTTLNTLRDPRKFEGWVITMARRIAIKLRSQRERHDRAAFENLAEPVVCPDMGHTELCELLRNEVFNLDTASRDVLLLHYFAGESTAEIARSLEISREAAKKRLQRARQALSENLLGHLGETAKPARDFATQRRAIMGLVAVATVGWGAGAGAATPLARAAGSTKLLAIAGCGMVTLGGLAYMTGTAGKGPEGTPSAPPTKSQPEPAAVVAPAAAQGADSPDSNQVAETTPPVSNTDAGAVVYALDGYWKACEKHGLLHPINVLRMETSGHDLVVYGTQTGVQEERVASGTVQQGELVVSVEGQDGSRLAGTLDESDAFVLAGALDVDGVPVPVEISLTRMTDREEAELDILAKRAREVEMLVGALQAYADDHGKQYPDTLEQLRDTYLDDPNLAVSAPSRVVGYAPEGLASMPDPNPYPDAATHTERLVKQEADRMAAWTNFPVFPPQLSIVYAVPPMTLACQRIASRHVQRVDGHSIVSCPPAAGAEPAGKVAALMASCINNMKQLGLVLKMFANEDRENSFPGGWAMTIPDYLVDTKVLTCPGLGEEDGPGRTVSYSLLFPGLREDDMGAIAADLGIEAQAGGTAQAVVPLVVEIHDCAERGKSHVLFADGHVETFTSGRWKERIAPFVAYADQLSGGQ